MVAPADSAGTGSPLAANSSVRSTIASLTEKDVKRFQNKDNIKEEVKRSKGVVKVEVLGQMTEWMITPKTVRANELRSCSW